MSDERLPVARDEAPPPPSARLLDAVRGMKPVRTRAPRLALGAVLAVAAVVVAALLLSHSLRADLPWLPAAGMVAIGAAWALGAVGGVGVALLPRRRQVLPSGVRALRVAVGVTVALVALAVLAPPEAPGHTEIPVGAEAISRAARCTATALAVAAPILIAGVLALRRVDGVARWRLGAALGAGGGAVGGFALHLICRFGGAFHVGAGHAGAVALAALLGAALVPGALALVGPRSSTTR